MKLRDIVAGMPVLQQVYNMEMETSAAVKVATNILRLEEPLKAWQKVEPKLYEKYGKRGLDDKGNEVITLDPAKRNEFNKERDEALDQELDVTLEQISVKDVSDALKPAHLAVAKWMFKEMSNI